MAGAVRPPLREVLYELAGTWESTIVERQPLMPDHAHTYISVALMSDRAPGYMKVKGAIRIARRSGREPHFMRARFGSRGYVISTIGSTRGSSRLQSAFNGAVEAFTYKPLALSGVIWP